MFRDFILILLGIIIAYLIPHFQDITHGILSSPRNWRGIVRGIKASWKGWLVIIVIAGLIAFGLGKYDEAQTRALIEAEDQRNIQLIEAVIKAVEDANKPLREDIQSLIEEIRRDRDERNNDSKP